MYSSCLKQGLAHGSILLYVHSLFSAQTLDSLNASGGLLLASTKTVFGKMTFSHQNPLEEAAEVQLWTSLHRGDEFQVAALCFLHGPFTPTFLGLLSFTSLLAVAAAFCFVVILFF